MPIHRLAETETEYKYAIYSIRFVDMEEYDNPAATYNHISPGSFDSLEEAMQFADSRLRDLWVTRPLCKGIITGETSEGDVEYERTQDSSWVQVS